MPKKIEPRNAHLDFIVFMGIFVLIFALIGFVVLIIPLYWYLVFFLVGYKVNKWTGFFCSNKKDFEDVAAIKGQSKVFVGIVGAGFSGLCTGIKLKAAGIKFKIFEANSDAGGTWWANRYPGCRTDSYCFLYQVKS